MSNTGKRLRESNEEILKYIQQLRDQRNELEFLVEKQKTEIVNLESEMSRITYKLSLINKSLNQRSQALKLYDATIMEIEAKYKGLADSTQGLLKHLQNESSHLENSIDKRIGTEKDCSDCPPCETTTQNQNVMLQTQRKSQVLSNDFPIKQRNDGQKRRLESRGTLERELGDNPFYSRAMEYPMVLSPMIDKENVEHMKEKTSQQVMKMPETSSNNDNTKVRTGHPSLASEVLSVVNENQPKNDILIRISSESTLGTGNFIDGDYNDMRPSRDTTEKISPKPKEQSKSEDVTPSLSPTRSYNYTSTTTPTDVEEKEKLMIDDYDEVIQDSESGALSKKNTLTSGKTYSSSADIFGPAYKKQHQLKEGPPSLARSKKSIFNRRDQTLLVTEENN